MKTWRVEDWDEAREERAAIMEYDGGLSREEADAASLEWLVDFLAPQILALAREHGRPRAEEWLGRYGSRYGAAAERQLRDKLNELRRGNAACESRD